MPDPPKTTGFQDIRDEVIERIQTRVWPQGSLLPTEVELAAEFGVARATVNRALRELADQASSRASARAARGWSPRR